MTEHVDVDISSETAQVTELEENISIIDMAIDRINMCIDMILNIKINIKKGS